VSHDRCRAQNSAQHSNMHEMVPVRSRVCANHAFTPLGDGLSKRERMAAPCQHVAANAPPHADMLSAPVCAFSRLIAGKCTSESFVLSPWDRPRPPSQQARCCSAICSRSANPPLGGNERLRRGSGTPQSECGQARELSLRARCGGLLFRFGETAERSARSDRPAPAVTPRAASTGRRSPNHYRSGPPTSRQRFAPSSRPGGCAASTEALRFSSASSDKPRG
jgi:hypothetical protein